MVDQWNYVFLGYVAVLTLTEMAMLTVPNRRIGIITVCQGVTQSFGGLVACRRLLGAFEAGFMPGLYTLRMPFVTWANDCRLHLLDCNVL